VTASANIDLVRSIYAAWERGDFTSADWAHPGIEVVLADGPTPATWNGLAEMARGWRDVLDAWEDFRAEAEEYRVLDKERVLAFVHNRGRGKVSGMEVDQMRTGANLFHLRDGKVTRMVIYWSCDRALADLGLPSGAGSQK
jgi:ketosteroid isomerase-like protein